MKNIYAVVLCALVAIGGCSVTTPNDESVPHESGLDVDTNGPKFCREACDTDNDCGFPCGDCVGARPGVRGTCLTSTQKAPESGTKACRESCTTDADCAFGCGDCIGEPGRRICMTAQASAPTPMQIPAELTPAPSAVRGCQESCWGSWECEAPCKWCAGAGTNTVKGKCITNEALQPGDVIL